MSIKSDNLQACGAKYQIQEELLDETDVDDVVVALVNMARKVSFGIDLSFSYWFNAFLLDCLCIWEETIITIYIYQVFLEWCCS